MKFNEDSRVKIPALLHSIRLGYKYIPLKEQIRIEDNNIFSFIFISKICEINSISEAEALRILDEINLELDYEDLGKKFYERLTATSGIKLIDFDKFENNSFHITTELICKSSDEEVRPDITVLIKGITLAFIEVKKPHHKEGVIDERNRINIRFKNKHFRRFANISQLLVFSNNMEYEGGIVEAIFGAFYASQSYKQVSFNFFREDADNPVKQPLLNLNIKQNQELAQLRDWLLSMLMNGQITEGGVDCKRIRL